MSAPKFVLYKKPLENGEWPVRIRIYADREYYVSIGLSCKPSEWDNLTRRFNGLKTSQKALNRLLDKREQEAVEIWSKLDPFDIDKFKRKWLNNGSDSVGDFIQFVKDKLSYGNYQKYLQVWLVLDDYTTNVSFSQISKSFLKDFEAHLLYERKYQGQPLKNSTIRFYFATIAAMFNKAIEWEWVEPKMYPFKNQLNPTGFSFAKYKSSKPKPRAVSKDTIIKLKELDLKDSLKFTRDLFIFSYLSRGMSYVDMALLKKVNIQKNRIFYTRKKTRHEVPSILITKEMQEILDRYITKSEYLFPIVTETDDEKIHWQIVNTRRVFNNNLNILGEMIDSETKLTTYVSRYSFANIAIDSGADIRQLKDLMGHADVNTTIVYVNEVSKSELDKFQNLL